MAEPHGNEDDAKDETPPSPPAPPDDEPEAEPTAPVDEGMDHTVIEPVVRTVPAAEQVQHGGVGEEGVGHEVGDTEGPGGELEPFEEAGAQALALVVVGDDEGHLGVGGSRQAGRASIAQRC